LHVADIATWSFSSHQKVMKSLRVDTWHIPLQSIKLSL
jgi:hypothetical protein